ncbi:alanine racemase [Candidatus Sumerlaeota bacterium]|nr:alanine racemase [Candidatus Sumerlaeota bacterium]
MNQLSRNTWVEIDLDQFERNIRTLQDFVARGVKLAPVIKADAYGHGAVRMATELERMNVAYLAVAILSEALELRANNIASPLLIMGYTENHLLGMAVQNNITVTIFEYEQAEILSKEAGRRGKTAKVHIKVDTGFNRLGEKPSERFADDIVRMKRLPNLSLEGVFSHLRLANPETDLKQYELFRSFIKSLEEKGVHFQYAHIADSIAAVKYKEWGMDMIRPGAIIYGYVPKYQVGMIDVKPVMSFKTRVTRVRKLEQGEGVGYSDKFRAEEGAVVATLAAGYADGYPRHLSGKGEALIRGKRARVIGIICMDQMMVDVTHIDDVKRGDEAILFGTGEGTPSVEELSVLANTNKNNIISGISRRAPRIYIKEGNVLEIVDYLALKKGDGK